jgi:hypothetical protein
MRADIVRSTAASTKQYKTILSNLDDLKADVTSITASIAAMKDDIPCIGEAA